ncbi:HEPH [Mytilus edulis]|uniref:HEPH n=1 Tax=Mytilus edulis TaxID=6550 RepID=A0A8S3RMD7_MYTED|nr:HEPH [Mytilus edulis]
MTNRHSNTEQTKHINFVSNEKIVSVQPALSGKCLASNGKCGEKNVSCNETFGPEWTYNGKCCSGRPCCKFLKAPCVPETCPNGFKLLSNQTSSANCYSTSSGQRLVSWHEAFVRTLNPDNSRKDVDREFVLYADIINETNSWLIEQSLNLCLNPQRCRQLFNQKNEPFISDTLMSSINGYIYGNLPDFPVYEGEKVAFYAMGLNLGLHVFGVQGQSFTFKHKRTHGVVFGIAWFEGLYMTARNPGRWLIFCKVNYHFNHGMAAFVNVMPRPGILPSLTIRRTRRYFIALEEIVWDYRPSGRVLARVGKGSTERSRIEERFFTSDGAIGGRFVKAVFIEYTDESFKKRKKRCKDDKHLGILGPPVRVEVGEKLEIILFNKASRPYSFNPFGLAFTKDNEGAFYKNDRNSSDVSGAAAMPGQHRRYIFTVPWDYGPTKEDPQCITETYQSFVDYARDQYSGLIGPLLICKPGTLNARGRQHGVNKEFFLMLMNWFEQGSWYFNQSISLAMLNAINGRVFGNIGGFDMCVGDRVSWHVLGFGERFDYQNPVFEGNNIQYDGRMVDHVTVFPGTSQTVFMIPDNPGNFMFSFLKKLL